MCIRDRNEAISILVDSVQTKLTVAKDASAARSRPDWDIPPPDYAYAPPGDDFPPDWDDRPMGNAYSVGAPGVPVGLPGNGTATRTAAPSAANGTTGRPPSPSPVAEPAAAYAVAPAVDDYSEATADEDEDNYWAEEDTSASAEMITLPDPAAVEEAREPQPQPVVEMPNVDNRRPPPDDHRLQTTDHGPQTTEKPNGNQPMSSEPFFDLDPSDRGPSSVVGRPLDRGPSSVTPMPSRILVVEIRASGNWKEACRQIVKLAGRFEGSLGLRLQLAGQNLVMDFPSQRTDSALELVEQLERLPGVGRVYER